MSARRKDVSEFNEPLPPCCGHRRRRSKTPLSSFGAWQRSSLLDRGATPAHPPHEVYCIAESEWKARWRLVLARRSMKERGASRLCRRRVRIVAFLFYFLSLLLFMRGCFSRPGADVCVESFVYVRVCVRVCRLTTVWALAFFRVVECSARRV